MTFLLILAALATIAVTGALTWLLWRLNAPLRDDDSGSDADADASK